MTQGGRGMAKRSLDLIEAMRAAAEAAQPITGRGVGYKLFAAGLIPSMGRSDMQAVYRLLRIAREQGIIPWEWIVDETRELERVATWDNPEQYGLYMSQEDLPNRIAEYGGQHVTLTRIALLHHHTRGLQSFLARDKRKDPRYKWFISHYGSRCWELDAMDPNDLRNHVESEIEKLIEPTAWQRCETVNRAEKESLKTILEKWGAR
jgi:hypothetical protein